MTLEEMQNLLDEDVKIDSGKLQYEAGNNPVVYGRWLRIYADVKKNIVALEAKKKTAMRDRLNYHTGRSDDFSPFQYDKSELKVVIAADESVLTIDTKIAYLNLMLDFSSKALDIIKARGFAIKNMIELRSLEAGR